MRWALVGYVQPIRWFKEHVILNVTDLNLSAIDHMVVYIYILPTENFCDFMWLHILRLGFLMPHVSSMSLRSYGVISISQYLLFKCSILTHQSNECTVDWLENRPAHTSSVGQRQHDRRRIAANTHTCGWQIPCEFHRNIDPLGCHQSGSGPRVATGSKWQFLLYVQPIHTERPDHWLFSRPLLLNILRVKGLIWYTCKYSHYEYNIQHKIKEEDYWSVGRCFRDQIRYWFRLGYRQAAVPSDNRYPSHNSVLTYHVRRLANWT